MASKAKGVLKGVSLLKRGWHEIPEIMCGLVLIAASAVGVGVAYFRYDKDTYHRYRFEYTVVRDTDVTEDLCKKKLYN